MMLYKNLLIKKMDIIIPCANNCSETLHALFGCVESIGFIDNPLMSDK